MYRLSLVVFALLFAACASDPMPVPDSADTPTQPVAEPMPAASTPVAVVELFTSEGCSSCPPADALLTELATHEGVIALSFHVDYWNYLGWRDPYSDEAFSQRQRAYAPTLDGRVYTPQLVVDGTTGFVGSRRTQASRAIAAARSAPDPVAVTVTAQVEGAAIRATYSITDAPAGAVLHLALVQHVGEQAVRRGENRGRTLQHTNIVRVLETVEAVSGTHRLILPDDLAADDVQVVAYVQTDRVGPILGAAVASA